jgi:hypothetical protein
MILDALLPRVPQPVSSIGGHDRLQTRCLINEPTEYTYGLLEMVPCGLVLGLNSVNNHRDDETDVGRKVRTWLFSNMANYNLPTLLERRFSVSIYTILEST